MGKRRPKCRFCEIAAGRHDGEVIRHEDANAIAFDNARPLYPVHVLIVPKEHITSPVELCWLFGHLVNIAHHVALDLGIAARGYRLLLNYGADGGQHIEHLHFHLVGGKYVPFT